MVIGYNEKYEMNIVGIKKDMEIAGAKNRS